MLVQSSGASRVLIPTGENNDSHGDRKIFLYREWTLSSKPESLGIGIFNAQRKDSVKLFNGLQVLFQAGYM